MTVTYLYIREGRFYCGLAEDHVQALRASKEMGALEVFILKGDVEKLIKEGIGVKKMYNLVRIVDRYNLRYENTIK